MPGKSIKTRSSSPEGKRPRGRPNDPSIDEALLKAAYEEFVEKGYGGMSMEAIALRAGVSKVSLYRRWGNKAAIAGDVFRKMAEEEPDIEAETLEDYVRGFVRDAIGGPLARERGKLAMRTIGEIAADDELLAIYRDQLLKPRIEQMRRIVERSRRRGELVAGAKTDAVCAIMAGPLFLIHIVYLSKIDLKWGGDIEEQITRLVLGGIGAKG